MTNMILTAVLVLGAIGAFFAVVLYFVAQKFKVEENPLIDEVADVLPGANCGGCGFAGCRSLAEAFVKQGNMDGLSCTAGGSAVAEKVAAILGCVAEAKDPEVAVVRCNGTCSNITKRNQYDGLEDCAFASSLYVGESGCAFGCLGLGNCVKVCQFGALSIDPETGIATVDDEKCVACGACVKACPRGIIQLRKKGEENRCVYVACNNKDKGADAMKVCKTSCIGCGKCAKNCPHSAITMDKNLAHIDDSLCQQCMKCVEDCPRHAIIALNIPMPEKASETETNTNN